MSALRQLIRNHPMISFATLACLFGWMSFILAAVGVGANPDNMPLGPLMAAAIVAGCQRRAELRRWGRSLRSWRISPSWYAIAVLVPIAIHVIIVLINHAFGAPLPTSEQLAGWTDIPGTFVVMLILVGIGEEAGWTAFAAPLLLRRHSILVSWAILAPVRILWHLPLMLSGEMPWLVGILGNAGFQLIVLLMFRRTNGAWQLAAVWHATLNAFGGMFFFDMVTGADNARLGMLLGLAYALLATALVVRSGRTATVSPAMQDQAVRDNPGQRTAAAQTDDAR